MPDLRALSTPPPDYHPAAVDLMPLMIGPRLHDWLWEREQFRQVWLDYLGHGPEPVPLNLGMGAAEALEGVTRTLVSYQVEPGCRVEAYLLQPQVKGPFPAVVVFHPTTNDTINQPAGLSPPRELQFGLNLARRGFVTLCPRNYLWDYRGRPGPERSFGAFTSLVEDELLRRYPEWTGMGKMVWDGMRAVDVLLTLPTVDPQRVGCVGHSLGAKEVLYAMAFDERMQAGVSCEGGLGIPFSNWDAPWYLGAGIHDRPDLEHHQLLALAAPRALLILGGGLQPPADPGQNAGCDPIEDWAYVEAARPAYALYGVPERLGLYLHHHGHSLPPEAEALTYEWLERFLGE
ncbi:MAG: dienelactone hydrolase [Armatimonadetes bacterium]|nr:dienelactone hydrolase [Armatimonadota bacterium]